MAKKKGPGFAKKFKERRGKNKNPIQLPLLNIVAAISGIYLSAIIATSICQTSVSKGLLRFLLIAVISPLFAIFAMTVKRIITTLWGSFRDGVVLFAALGSVIMLAMSFTNKGAAAFLLILLLLVAGTALFNVSDKYFTIVTDRSIFDGGWAGILTRMAVSIKKYRGIALPKILEWSRFLKGKITAPDSIFMKALSRRWFLRGAVISVVGIAAVVLMANLFFRLFCTRVESFSPVGEVPLKAAIIVTFSDDITLARQDLEQVITDEPEQKSGKTATLFVKPGINLLEVRPTLKGAYRIEDGNTLVFAPDGDLQPATDYSVSINTERLKSQKRFILSKSFSFRTPHLKISGINVFYNYDFIKNIEKEIICEINFNHPVDIKELIKYTVLEIDGDRMKFSVEPSNIPSRFYVKSSNIQRGDSERKINIAISGGLPCIGGSIPLESKFEKTITLPATTKLEVASVDTFPIEGDTYIIILFNRPVSESMVKQYVAVRNSDKAIISFSVETEYCYAVLKANFLPNQVYRVFVKAGMRSITGEEKADTTDYPVSIRDLEPEVKFSSPGKILPLRGNLDIELYTLNLDSFDVQIEKVYRNNLVHFIRSRNTYEYGRVILSKSLKVEGGEINQKVKHYINLRNFHDMNYKGLFNIRLSSQSEDYNYDQQYILCTDLGLIARQSGPDLTVQVYSIMDLVPMAGVKLSLMSRESQVMREGYTDNNGECLFRDWKINKDNFVPLLVIAEKDDDFSFLEFYSTEVDASRFDIGGENISDKGMKAFVTPERGVYRPGEKAYVTAIVRKNDMGAPPQVNVQLYVTDPMENKYFLATKKIPAGGLLTFDVPIRLSAKTGEYSLIVRLNDRVILGRSTLKVEEFIPDKIKAEIKVPDAQPAPGKPVVFTVKGTQLFGPPASGRRVLTRVRFVSRIFQLPNFPGYTFNDEQATYSGEAFDLGEAKLDDRGEKTYSIDVPVMIAPPSALTMKVNAEVYDVGGRPVSTVKNIPIDHYSTYLGIRVARQNVYLIHQPVTVRCVAVNPRGAYVNVPDSKVVVKRKVYYSIMRRYGIFKQKYMSESYEEVIDQKDLPIKSAAEYAFVPKNPGEYTIYVYLDNGMKTSKKIFVQGPGMYSPNLEKAENLTITLNKEKYYPGETAVATIYSPIPGRLFVAIEREKVFETRSLMLENNRATVEFTLQQAHIPNVYISAFVVRTPDESMRDLPMTSLGIKSVSLDPGQRKMNLSIDCPEQTRSSRGLAVRLRAAPGSPVVISAVDEGILQITQFKTPDPFAFYYMKRALVTKLYSLFDAILPNVRAIKLAIGGDEGEYDLSRRHVNPVMSRRVQSVSLFSGVLYANENGLVDHFFKIPEFNGKLRVMAIGAQGENFGSTAKYVTVVDPIVLSPALPRMLAPGDSFEIPVLVYNQTGADGKCALAVSTQGPVKMEGSSTVVFLPNQSEKILYFYCRARKDAGVAKFNFTASMGNEVSTTSVELPVRPTRTIQTISKSGVLKPGKSISYSVPKDYLPFGRRVRFSVSPRYLTQFLGAMDYMVQYPYGCAEQITSQLFVLMYCRDIFRATGYFSDKAGSLDSYINDGIKQLEGMQLPSGEFSLWPGGMYPAPYLTDYISHFLIEARRRGFQVDGKVMKKIDEYIGLLRPVSKGRLDRREDYSWEQVRIYHLYLKALAGKPDIEAMKNFMANKLGEMNDVNKCLLASALAISGDRESARKVLPGEFKVKYFPRYLGGDYDSPVKRLSFYLMALCDVDPASTRRFSIAEDIVKRSINGGFETTHDNACALVALSKAFEAERETPIKATVYINKVPVKTVVSNTECIDLHDAAGKNVTLTNQGDYPMYFNLMVEGIPAGETVESTDDGIEVTRSYFNRDNSSLNLSNVAQGQVIIAKIKLKPKRENLENVVIVDLLPAGFEIDNVRLQSQGDVNSGVSSGFTPLYEDIRDDRLLLFTGSITESVTYAYTLRAVSVGRFIVPQAYAEAMYDPSVRSIGEAHGIVNVVRTGN
ncbi:MAG: Ig-like domain-containing protein [Spirochaetes bacterium]|nr:Ig-like domain-containing protein [Spirochaetota bacterium]